MSETLEQCVARSRAAVARKQAVPFQEVIVQLADEIAQWRRHFPLYKVVDGKLCYSGQMTADSATPRESL